MKLPQIFWSHSGDGSEAGGGQAPAVAEAIPKVPEPPRYAVCLLNDDYSTMEFVVEVLKTHFGKSEDEAVQIMLKVHREGKGVAGVYSFEIAEAKALQVSETARERGFPLKPVVEEMQ